jgi:hypothetical protein
MEGHGFVERSGKLARVKHSLYRALLAFSGGDAFAFGARDDLLNCTYIDLLDQIYLRLDVREVDFLMH